MEPYFYMHGINIFYANKMFIDTRKFSGKITKMFVEVKSLHFHFIIVKK